MQLIIEGCDGVGKTTVAEILADKYGCDILHMTRNGPKTIESYLHRYDQSGLISDRSFICEFIYSSVFNRTSEVTLKCCERLLDYVKMQGFKIIIFYCDYDEIMRRLKIRNNESSEILKNIDKISNAYCHFADVYDIPIIDVTNLTPDEIVKIIEEEIINV